MLALVYFALLLLLGIMIARRYRKIKRGRFPPGPPKDPILGHLRIFPKADPGKTFYEWSNQYGTRTAICIRIPAVDYNVAIGDVIHLDLLGKCIIILNSMEAATELLEKRGAKYSDRPFFAAFNLSVPILANENLPTDVFTPQIGMG